MLDGPPVRGNPTVQIWWLVTTTVIVLFLAGYGSIRLLADGSGGGQGPNPIATPREPKGDPPLQVQVIAQQWQFTYRFPGYGGRGDPASRAARPTRWSRSTSPHST